MSASDHTDPNRPGPQLDGDERLAAEYAMGLLEGEALLATRGRLAREPAFAGLAAQWEQRLAPMLDDAGAAAPSDHLWDRIAREVEEQSEQVSPVVAMQRRVVLWQRIAAGSAVAAIAALTLLFVPLGPADDPATGDAPNSIAASQPPLVASIPIADTPLRIGVTYLPDRAELLVAADGLSADGIHDHELWLVPPGEGAQVRSLGVVAPGEQRRVPLDPALAAMIHDGSQMVLTREPLGGKPPEQPAGPVVAEGAFAAI
ncbi:anti-sigma factor [Alteriqipengyuania lutimaris]|uniref:Anti-sigma K factor RskA C-terminal domain-containing protein n=1 Tax=Alteriqipengyuania lutimaris TaxID=1538146 RepID=A0A395LKX5_9SPHN|nr:anti-sigma factor [Alteriqipengyuania lutimaris]MBB3033508.1 anti-sigma-K factor RskA [Alteriqipengyuania lutimaris]RDS77481.1 hypothetical protein DL238_07595 [Alteriqipengyuania lutimaris]